MVTKDRLDAKLLFEEFEIVFAEKDGLKLLMVVDAYNEHIYWNIKYVLNGIDYYKEFNNYAEARDYFLSNTIETIKEEFNEIN